MSCLEYGLLMSDNSTDLFDLRDQLRMQLIVLNADLKRLNNDLDLSAVLRQYLEDTPSDTGRMPPPTLAQIERLRRQKERMTTLKEEEERKEQERKEQEQSRPAPLPAAAAPKRRGGGSKNVQIQSIPFNLLHKIEHLRLLAFHKMRMYLLFQCQRPAFPGIP